jgi:hypothetical protein
MTDWSGDVYDAPCTYVAMLYVLYGLSERKGKRNERGNRVRTGSVLHDRPVFFKSRVNM